MKFDGFDWDEGNIQKVQKHGVTPTVIENLFQGKVWIGQDITHSQMEDRFMAIGKSGSSFILVIFTMRKRRELSLIRPISARPMHEKEVGKYEKEIAKMENR